MEEKEKKKGNRLSLEAWSEFHTEESLQCTTEPERGV